MYSMQKAEDYSNLRDTEIGFKNIKAKKLKEKWSLVKPYIRTHVGNGCREREQGG